MIWLSLNKKLDKVSDNPVHGQGWAMNEINKVLQPYAFVLKTGVEIIEPENN